MSELIAERVFERKDGVGQVIVKMFAPEKVPAEFIWTTRIEIHGLPEVFVYDQPGADAFQALYLALRTICRELEKVEATLMFEGLSVELPIIATWDGDISLKSEVYRFIDDRILEAIERQRTK